MNLYSFLASINVFFILFKKILKVLSRKLGTLEVMNFVPNVHILEALRVASFTETEM